MSNNIFGSNFIKKKTFTATFVFCLTISTLLLLFFLAWCFLNVWQPALELFRSAKCGLVGWSALHIWFLSHTFPIWWASKAFYFNCKACSNSAQLICMFVCLSASAIGNLFSLLRGWKLKQPWSECIELPTGLKHYHAGLDMETYLAGFLWLQLMSMKINFSPLHFAGIKFNNIITLITLSKPLYILVSQLRTHILLIVILCFIIMLYYYILFPLDVKFNTRSVQWI